MNVELSSQLDTVTHLVQGLSKSVGTSSDRIEKQLRSISGGIEKINNKVDELQHLMLDLFERLEFPRFVTFEKSEIIKTKGFFSSCKRNVKRVLVYTGIKENYRLHLHCEGSPKGKEVVPCNRTHEGYDVMLDGPVVRALAPVIVFTLKVVNVAMVVGKLAGAPLPSFIPGLDSSSDVGAMIKNWGSFIKEPLDGDYKKLWDISYGKEDGAA
jgi:hypothetical protein